MRISPRHHAPYRLGKELWAQMIQKVLSYQLARMGYTILDGIIVKRTDKPADTGALGQSCGC